MTGEQLPLDMPMSYQPGDSVWWTHGLTYLCASYRGRRRLRPEHTERVTIKAVKDGDHFIIDVPSWPTPIHTCARWLSPDEHTPCEAVRRAYGLPE